MDVYQEAATANKGSFLFAYTDLKNDQQKKLGDFIGADKDSMPSLWAVYPDGMKKYKSEFAIADMTVESLTSFINDVKAGVVPQHLKSAEPEVNEGPMTIVVGKNFQDLVMDETKDVLVKYYAPWCGHCKKLAPVWDELADSFKDESDLLIAKYDATANENEGVQIKSFPTLIWYPKDNKAGVKYEGARELDSFKTYIEENSSVLASKKVGHDEL